MQIQRKRRQKFLRIFALLFGAAKIKDAHILKQLSLKSKMIYWNLKLGEFLIHGLSLNILDIKK